MKKIETSSTETHLYDRHIFGFEPKQFDQALEDPVSPGYINGLMKNTKL